MDYLERHLREVPLFRALLRSVECRLIEPFGPLEQPVLDLGSGDGHFASMLSNSPSWIGIDPDINAVRQAGRRGSHRSLIVGDGRRLPVANDSIATVVANSSLEHISDLEAAMAEISRAVRPGGHLLITAPSEKFAEMLLGSWFLTKIGSARQGQAYGKWFNRHSRHEHTDSLTTWTSRLERHGFLVMDSRTYFSERAHRAFDLAHYLSLPRLLTYQMTGKWVLLPDLFTNRLFYRWLKPFEEESAGGGGAYVFLHGRKAGG